MEDVTSLESIGQTSFALAEDPVEVINVAATLSSGSRLSHNTAIEKLNDLRIVLHAL